MPHEYAIDFGRNIKQQPENAIKPTSIKQIQEAISNSLNTNIAIRGMAHCTGGQSLAKNGFVIDMKDYAKIGQITLDNNGAYLIEAQAGASWKTVFDHSLQHGLMPPTFSDWLELTIGGTLSTGGVGQCSFKKGLQIDNVACIEVVTPTGETTLCNYEHNKELFDLARGGMGMFCIITRAWIRLEKAPERVHVFKLLFSDLSAFLNAQIKLMGANEIDAIQSHVVVTQEGEPDRRAGWPIPPEAYTQLPKQPQYYMLEVTKYADSLTTTDELKSFLASATKLEKSLIFEQEYSFRQHVFRTPPLLANPLELNNPKHHHCCFFIPANHANELLSGVFAHPDHLDAMGFGTILIIPVKRSVTSAPYFMLPNEENIFFVGILRRHLEPCHFDTLARINETTYLSVEKMGGKVYPVGSGSFLANPEFWRRHYEDKYGNLLRGKRHYDPNNRLSTNLIIG